MWGTQGDRLGDGKGHERRRGSTEEKATSGAERRNELGVRDGGDGRGERLPGQVAETHGTGAAALQDVSYRGGGAGAGGTEREDAGGSLWQPFSSEWLVEGAVGNIGTQWGGHDDGGMAVGTQPPSLSDSVEPEPPGGGGRPGCLKEDDKKNRKKKRKMGCSISISSDVCKVRNDGDTGVVRVRSEGGTRTCLDSLMQSAAQASGGSPLCWGTHLSGSHAWDDFSARPALRTLWDWLGSLACGLPKAM